MFCPIKNSQLRLNKILFSTIFTLFGGNTSLRFKARNLSDLARSQGMTVFGTARTKDHLDLIGS